LFVADIHNHASQLEGPATIELLAAHLFRLHRSTNCPRSRFRCRTPTNNVSVCADDHRSMTPSRERDERARGCGVIPFAITRCEPCLGWPTMQCARRTGTAPRCREPLLVRRRGSFRQRCTRRRARSGHCARVVIAHITLQLHPRCPLRTIRGHACIPSHHNTPSRLGTVCY
jgi:hypothetical protein